MLNESGDSVTDKSEYKFLGPTSESDAQSMHGW